METALNILTDRLISTGMTEVEVDHLLARFLQEEAFDYVDYIESHLKEESADSLYSQDKERYHKKEYSIILLMKAGDTVYFVENRSVR